MVNAKVAACGGPVLPRLACPTRRSIAKLLFIRAKSTEKVVKMACFFQLNHYYMRLFGSLAQLVEQLAFNQLVTGSNPVRPTISLFLVKKPSNTLKGKAVLAVL